MQYRESAEIADKITNDLLQMMKKPGTMFSKLPESYFLDQYGQFTQEMTARIRSFLEKEKYRFIRFQTNDLPMGSSYVYMLAPIVDQTPTGISDFIQRWYAKGDSIPVIDLFAVMKHFKNLDAVNKKLQSEGASLFKDFVHDRFVFRLLDNRAVDRTKQKYANLGEQPVDIELGSINKYGLGMKYMEG